MPLVHGALRPAELAAWSNHRGAAEVYATLALPREEATRQMSLPRSPLQTLVTQALPKPDEPAASEPQSAQTLKRGNQPGCQQALQYHRHLI